MLRCVALRCAVLCCIECSAVLFYSVQCSAVPRCAVLTPCPPRTVLRSADAPQAEGFLELVEAKKTQARSWKVRTTPPSSLLCSSNRLSWAAVSAVRSVLRALIYN